MQIKKFPLDHYHEKKKKFVVMCSNTISNPYTMVIHLKNASLTYKEIENRKHNTAHFKI